MAQNRSRRQVRGSRALGLTLTLKIIRYFEKHPYSPDKYGRSRRRRESDYAARLKERRHLRAQCDIREPQLRRAFGEVHRTTGLTGENLVELLEMRPDALAPRAGFVCMIQQAHQFVVHRCILVDGKIVDRPSFYVKPDQAIQVKSKSQTIVPFGIITQDIYRGALPTVPSYLDVEFERLKTILVRYPRRIEVPVTCDVQVVVEHYSH